jgi:hypothetical protein
MGYSSIILLAAVIVISSYVLFNNASFAPPVVTTAAAALFADTLGLIVSVWKVVFNPDFMTKLAPITQLEASEERFFQTPSAASTDTNIVIHSARYGIGDRWMDVAPLLRAKAKDGKVRSTVSNEEFGGDPAHGVEKQLEVTYSYRGRTYTKTVPENQTLSLPEQ